MADSLKYEVRECHSGCDTLVEITLGDELYGLLHKALEVEKGFETVAEWEGYVGVKKKEFRDILFKLVSDSNGHARTLDSMLKKVRKSRDYYELPLQPRSYNFRGRNELEVMSEISKIEKLMFDLYSDIRESLEDSDIEVLLTDGEDAASFLAELDNLKNDEARHMSIISKYVSNVDRLR